MGRVHSSTWQNALKKLKNSLYKPSDNEIQLKNEVDELRQQIEILHNRCDFLDKKVREYQMSLYVYHSMMKQFEHGRSQRLEYGKGFPA